MDVTAGTTDCYGGCYGCYGYAPVYYGAVTTGVTYASAPVQQPAAAPATITVNVPADAVVSVDGAKTSSTSTERVFASPDLKPGTIYYYTLTAEVVREGKTLTAREVITVEAGKNTKIALNPTAPAATVASR